MTTTTTRRREECFITSFEKKQTIYLDEFEILLGVGELDLGALATWQRRNVLCARWLRLFV